MKGRVVGYDIRGRMGMVGRADHLGSYGICKDIGSCSRGF